jgi:integrase
LVGIKFDMNPYDKLRGAFARGDRETVEFLTVDELKRNEGLKLPSGGMLSLARDLFVFQAYTGMAFSDMQAFSLRDCRRDGKRWLLAKERVKTGVTYYVQILPQALAVAQKYGGEMPQVVGQVYNRALKDLAAMAGIDKRVTSHVARHTFATWMLHEEVPIERVAKMLGHSNIRQTQRYAKVLPKAVYDDFEKVAAKMEK